MKFWMPIPPNEAGTSPANTLLRDEKTKFHFGSKNVDASSKLDVEKQKNSTTLPEDEMQ